MSLLAMQTERLVRDLIRKAPRPLDYDAIREARTPEEVTRIINEAVRTLRKPPRPRAYSFQRKPSPGRDLITIHRAAWDLNPLEGADEPGLVIYAESLFRGPTIRAGYIPPSPRAFVSIHAVNRIHERVPRYTALDVYKLAFRFAALATAVGLMERHRNEVDGVRRHGGSYRLPVGQCLAQADLIVTDTAELRLLGGATAWCDVRTVVPTSNQAEIAQARACVAALEAFDWMYAPEVDIPYIPRRGDSFTLGIAKGKLLS